MPFPTKKVLAIASASALSIGAVITLGSGGAQAASSVQQDSSARAADYLARQITDGGFVAKANGDPNVGNTVRAALGLAVAGHDKAAFDRSVAYLKLHVSDYIGTSTISPAAAGLLAVVAVAHGDDPTSFGGTNLVTAIDGTQDHTSGLYHGAFGDAVLDQSLALIGLAAAAAPNTGHVATGLSYLSGQECADGAFQYDVRSSGAACTFEDTNTTSYAVLALSAFRQPLTTKAALLTWLHGAQQADGGFGYGATDDSDADSTGLVGTALAVLGIDPDGATFAKDGHTPSSWLRDRQLTRTATSTDDGAYPSGFDKVYATSEAMAGQLGVGLPLRPVAVTDDSPRDPLPASSPSPSPTPTAARVTVTGPVLCTIVIGDGVKRAVPAHCVPTANPTVLRLAPKRPTCKAVVVKGKKVARPKGCVPAKKKK